MKAGWMLLFGAAVVAGCDTDDPVARRLPGARGEPPLVKVVHVLVAFRSAQNAPESVTRTREEAEALANDLLARARGGEDFQKLVKEYSTDTGSGSYAIANHGQPSFGAQKRRTGMVEGFTKVAFSLAVGEVGLAPYDPKDAPYGFHVIKRVE